MKEEYRDIEGYPGYQVSNKGNVRSNRHVGKRVYNPDEPFHDIVPVNYGNGRLGVCLSNGHKRKCVSIGRLVAEAFIPNENNYPIVRHINDIPYDNDVRNLAWGTSKDNSEDSKRNGTSDRESRRKYVKVTNLKTGETFIRHGISNAAKDLGLSSGNVSAVLAGTRTHTGGYSFEILDCDGVIDYYGGNNA